MPGRAFLRLSAIDMIVAAPPRPGFRIALSNRLGVPLEQISVAHDERMHTAALAAAFERQVKRLSGGVADSLSRRRCGRDCRCRSVSPAAATRGGIDNLRGAKGRLSFGPEGQDFWP